MDTVSLKGNFFSFSMAMWLHGFQLAQSISRVRLNMLGNVGIRICLIYVIKNGHLQSRKNTCSQEEHFFIEENF